MVKRCLLRRLQALLLVAIPLLSSEASPALSEPPPGRAQPFHLELQLSPIGELAPIPDLSPLRELAPRAQREAPAPELRRLLRRETTPDIARHARRLIDAHAREPIGTEFAFESRGERFVARHELHFHPPGGDKKPWGQHPGVSVFTERPWP